jgi:hypothetical protein
MKTLLNALILLAMVSPLCAKDDASGSAAAQASEIPGFKVAVGETIDIITDAKYISMFKFRDGRIVVGNRLSRDGGKTWTRSEIGRALGPYAFELPDGEVILPLGPQVNYEIHKVGEGVFEVPFARSTDGGKTFKTERARLNIPDGTGGTNDDGTRSEGPAVDHAIVQLRDGSLLMAMYGQFKDSTTLVPGFPSEWKVHKYYSWVMRSTDRGRTWDYWATVAKDPSVGCESFCEPDLLALPNGDILCFLRTGGEKPPTPLYMNVSKDQGKTWSKPVAIADRGVWPNACRMQSGLLVVTYGRPDNWLAFSADDGKTWVGHLQFNQGEEPATTSYNSVEEVSPGKLLVVFDYTKSDADGKQRRVVAGTFVNVTAK